MAATPDPTPWIRFLDHIRATTQTYNIDDPEGPTPIGPCIFLRLARQMKDYLLTRDMRNASYLALWMNNSYDLDFVPTDDNLDALEDRGRSRWFAGLLELILDTAHHMHCDDEAQDFLVVTIVELRKLRPIPVVLQLSHCQLWSGGPAVAYFVCWTMSHRGKIYPYDSNDRRYNPDFKASGYRRWVNTCAFHGRLIGAGLFQSFEQPRCHPLEREIPEALSAGQSQSPSRNSRSLGAIQYFRFAGAVLYQDFVVNSTWIQNQRWRSPDWRAWITRLEELSMDNREPKDIGDAAEDALNRLMAHGLLPAER